MGVCQRLAAHQAALPWPELGAGGGVQHAAVDLRRRAGRQRRAAAERRLRRAEAVHVAEGLERRREERDIIIHQYIYIIYKYIYIYKCMKEMSS